MRVTLRLLGLEVFSLEATTDEEATEGCSLDGGTTASYPVGFTWERGDGFADRPEYDD